MMRMVFAAAFALFFFCDVRAAEAPAALVLTPPRSPAHAQRVLESASDVTRDLLETISFLEAGQSFYKAYARGTHTPDENKAFIKFLEDYERELATAKKEFAILQTWFSKNSALKGG